MKLTFSQTHTGDLAKRLCLLADRLSLAEKNNDLEAMVEYETNLKSCAMELIATLDFKDQETELAKQAITHALTVVQSVAAAMTQKKNDYTLRAARDRHIRLVYAKE